MYFINISI